MKIRSRINAAAHKNATVPGVEAKLATLAATEYPRGRPEDFQPAHHNTTTLKKNTMSKITPPTDLTSRPPRSARVRLGGYVILPRMLDKLRATLAGTNGDYHYACPLDQRFLTFAGLDAEALKAEATQGRSDFELLEWIRANAKNKPTEAAIFAWSAYEDNRAPANVGGREYLGELHKGANANRDDISTWFDILDADDFVSFGGKA